MLYGRFAIKQGSSSTTNNSTSSERDSGIGIDERSTTVSWCCGVTDKDAGNTVNVLARVSKQRLELYECSLWRAYSTRSSHSSKIWSTYMRTDGACGHDASKDDRVEECI